MYLGLGHNDLVKRSKVAVTAGRQHHIFHTNEGSFTQFWSRMCLHS